MGNKAKVIKVHLNSSNISDFTVAAREASKKRVGYEPNWVIPFYEVVQDYRKL